MGQASQACFNPRLLVDEQATRSQRRAWPYCKVSTHACSLMSRRPRASSHSRTARRFNPRLLVDEQATALDASSLVEHVSTHACSLMSRRPLLIGASRWISSFNPRLLVDEQATRGWCRAQARRGLVSTHACSLMSRRRFSACSSSIASCFNPRLLVDEQATRRSDRCRPLPCFNPRLLVDEQATVFANPVVGTSTVSTHACSLMSRRLHLGKTLICKACAHALREPR